MVVLGTSLSLDVIMHLLWFSYGLSVSPKGSCVGSSVPSLAMLGEGGT
jgi:hypothetical protein